MYTKRVARFTYKDRNEDTLQSQEGPSMRRKGKREAPSDPNRSATDIEKKMREGKND